MAERLSRARTTGSCREAHRVDRAAHHPEFKSHTIGFVRLAARDFSGTTMGNWTIPTRLAPCGSSARDRLKLWNPVRALLHHPAPEICGRTNGDRNGTQGCIPERQLESAGKNAPRSRPLPD